MMRKLLLIILILFCTTPAWSTTYYIANGGNDSCNGTSPTIGSSGSCAWKTISKVNGATFSAGDSILFNKGDTWLEQLTISSSGSSGHPIIFAAYGTGDDPIITGSNTRDHCIILNGKNYITLSHIELTGAQEIALEGGTSQYITIDHVTIKNTRKFGLSFYAGDHVTISNSAFSNIATTSTPDNGDGIYLGCDEANNPCTNFTIDTCTFTESFGRWAIAITGLTTGELKGCAFTPTALGLGGVIDFEPNPNQEVSGVSVYNNTFNISVATDSIEGSAQDTAILSGISIYNNTIEHNSVGKKGICMGYRGAGTSYIYGNAISKSTADGISVHVSSGPVATVNIYRNKIDTSSSGTAILAEGSSIVANVYYNVLNGVYSGVSVGAKGTCNCYNNTVVNYTLYGLHSSGTLTAYNNLLYTTGNNARGMYAESGSTVNTDYNSYFFSPWAAEVRFTWTTGSYNTFVQYQSQSGQESHSIDHDPLFISSTDFHLQSTSPCINIGTPVGLTQDYDGHTVPYGPAPDIGAYEYGAGSVPSGSNDPTLTVTESGTGTGTVTSSPAGINCGSTCTAGYNSGTVVTLTAVPDSGHSFAGWSGGGCAGAGSCSLTMNTATSVTATFTAPSPPANYSLTTLKSGTGAGYVISTPSGIICGTSCSGDYSSGTVVTLTATPDTGKTFTGWSGAGCSGMGSCVVTMNATQTVTANFGTPAAPNHWRLYILKSGKNKVGAVAVAGNGSITSSPAGIDCGTTCEADYTDGTEVTLTASPDSGSSFTGWSGGGCSGTGSCRVSTKNDTSVTVSFTSNSSSGSGDIGRGGGDSCFIATAAYGSYLDPHVYVLRNFRDRYLLTNFLGQVFVNSYYKYSPPVADFIGKHETLKTAARWALTPVVCGVEHPYTAASTLLIIPAVIVLALRRRKLKGSH